MSKRIKIAGVVAGVLLAAIIVILLVPPSRDVTVTFSRYENNIPVLAFTNRSSGAIMCSLRDSWWIVDEIPLTSVRVGSFREKKSTQVFKKEIVEIALKHIPPPNSLFTKIDCVQQPRQWKLNLEELMRRLSGFKDLRIFPRKAFSLSVEIPPMVGATNGNDNHQ